VYLEGDDLVISFAGDMGTIGISVDHAVEQATSSAHSLSNEGSSAASFGLGANVAGFGLSLGIDWAYSNSKSTGTEKSHESASERSLSFELSDPDLGDSFDVVIRRDPVYNTPVFITRSGRSRCKHEKGTVERELLEMKIDNPQYADDGTAISYTLTITNNGLETEDQSFSYFLNLDTETNPNGWSVTANGVPIMYNSVRITIPPNIDNSPATQAKIVVSCSRDCKSDLVVPLLFRLTGICYEDIISPPQYAYSLNTTLVVDF
jgi:hypothetical protein